MAVSPLQVFRDCDDNGGGGGGGVDGDDDSDDDCHAVFVAHRPSG